MTTLQCDPGLRAEAVDQYLQDAKLIDYQMRIHSANKAYEQQQEAMREDVSNHKTTEKKLADNDKFFRKLLNAEICDLIGNLAAMDYQQKLQLDIAEELKNEIEKYLAEKQLTQQIAAAQLDEEHKHAIEAIAKSSLANAETKLNNLETRINNIEHEWGGKTWEEGVNKHADELAKNFGKDLLGINLSNKTDEEKQAINNVLAAAQHSLKEDLVKTISPEKGLEILNKAEAASAPAPAPGVPAAPPPPMMKPGLKETTIKSQVLTELKFFFAMQKLITDLNKILPPAEQIQMNIKQISKQVNKQGGLDEYIKKIEKFSELPDLKKGLLEAKSLVNDLKSKETFTPAAPSRR